MYELPDSWDYLESDDQPIRTTYNMGRNWNTEDKFKLISLCEKHPVLWDTSFQFYRELVRRRKALDEIRQQFDDKFSITEINAQWRNLKDVFHKNKHQMFRMAKAGNVFRDPTWKYYKPLKFLLKCEKVRSLNNNNSKKPQLTTPDPEQQKIKNNPLRNTMMPHSTSLDVFGLPEEEMDFNNDYNDGYEDFEVHEIPQPPSSIPYYYNGFANSPQQQYVRHPITNLHRNPNSPIVQKSFIRVNQSRELTNKNLEVKQEIPDESCEDSISIKSFGFGSPNTTTTISSTDTLLGATKSHSPSSVKPPSTDPAPSISMKLRSRTAAEEGRPRPLPYNIRFNEAITSRRRSKEASSEPTTIVTLKKAPSILRKRTHQNFNALKQFEHVSDISNLFSDYNPGESTETFDVKPEIIEPPPKLHNETELVAESEKPLNDSNPEEILLDVEAPNKFKYLGTYVETALLDMHHQNPKLARNLLGIIYAAIGKHQNLLCNNSKH